MDFGIITQMDITLDFDKNEVIQISDSYDDNDPSIEIKYKNETAITSIAPMKLNNDTIELDLKSNAVETPSYYKILSNSVSPLPSPHPQQVPKPGSRL